MGERYALSPERREDFYTRLAQRYSERTGLPVEECRALAEEANRGVRGEHFGGLLMAGLSMLSDALYRATPRRRR